MSSDSKTLVNNDLRSYIIKIASNYADESIEIASVEIFEYDYWLVERPSQVGNEQKERKIKRKWYPLYDIDFNCHYYQDITRPLFILSPDEVEKAGFKVSFLEDYSDSNQGSPSVATYWNYHQFTFTVDIGNEGTM